MRQPLTADDLRWDSTSAARGGFPAADQDSISAAIPRIAVAAERFRFRTAAQLSSEELPEPAWTVHAFAAKGVITEIDGKLKASGKTTFIAYLIAAILCRRPFLGRSTRYSPIVWLTEERPATFLETLKRAGLSAATDLHILHWHDAKGHPWPGVVRHACEYGASVGAEVLVVDTIGQWAGLRGDAENNNGDQMAAVEPLQEAAAKDYAVIVARHERKGGGEVGESGRGGSAFSGAVDIVVSIRRAEGHTKPTVRVLHTLSRFTETPDTLVIDLTPDGYVALGTEGTVAVMEAERAILDRLPDSEDAALPLDEIRKGEPNIARTVAQEALKKLADVGVQRIGSGKKGHPYRWFLPVNDSAATQISTHGSIQKGAADGFRV